MIVANQVGEGKGFYLETNNLVVIDPQHNQFDLGQGKKIELARKLAALIAEQIV